MKTLFLISIMTLTFFTCSSQKNFKWKNDNTYYFYFDSNNSKEMLKYYNNKNGPLNYLYKIDRINNIIFTPKNKRTRHNPKRIEISRKDTTKLNIKSFKWLNEYSENWKNIVKLRNTDKDIYIIEKDTLDNKLYLINVVYKEEIE